MTEKYLLLPWELHCSVPGKLYTGWKQELRIVLQRSDHSSKAITRISLQKGPEFNRSSLGQLMPIQSEKQSNQLTISGNHQLGTPPTKADSTTGIWGKEIWQTVLQRLLWSLGTVLLKATSSGEQRVRGVRHKVELNKTAQPSHYLNKRTGSGMGLEPTAHTLYHQTCPWLLLNQISKAPLSTEAHANNPSIWKAEVRGSWVWN